MAKAVCDRGDCERPAKAKGLCERHYGQQRSRGHRHREDRVLPTRARNRALAALAALHKEEFQSLYDQKLAEVQAEDAELRRLAEEQGVEVTNDAQIFRLKRGPAGEDEETEDRALLTAEPACKACALAHERGHACPECGARIGMPVERAKSAPPARKSAEQILAARAAETAATLASYGHDSRYQSPPPPAWEPDEEIV